MLGLLNFARNCQIFSRAAVPFCIPNNSVQKFLLLCILAKTMVSMVSFFFP